MTRDRVTRVIDAVIEAGSCDFVDRTSRCRCRSASWPTMMGVPDEDLPRLFDWTEQIEAAQRAAGAERRSGDVRRDGGVPARADPVARSRGTEETLVTRAARRRGRRASGSTDDEILVFFALLVFAGNDTTRNTAATGILALLEHPDQWRRLCDDRELIGSRGRGAAPLHVGRQLVRPHRDSRHRARGQRIAEGEKVVIWYTSASRDEEVYRDPQRLDIGRSDQAHKRVRWRRSPLLPRRRARPPGAARSCSRS